MRGIPLPHLLPEVSHVRPVAGREAFDRSAMLLRKQIPCLGVLALLASGPLAVLSVIIPDTQEAATPNDIVLYLLVYMLTRWPSAALVAASFQAYLTPNARLRPIPFLMFALRRLPAVILTEVFLFLLMMFMIAMITSVGSLGVAGSLISAAMGTVCMFGVIRCLLVSQVVVLEGRSMFAAVERSWHLMGASFRPGTQTLPRDSAMRRGILLFLPAVVLYALSFLAHQFKVTTPQYLAMLDLGTNVLFVSWLSAAFAHMYVDCLINIHGWDLEVRISELQRSTAGSSLPS